MRVVYRGRTSWRSKATPIDDGNVIELLHNNWDDYGNKTTFMTACRVGGEIVELGQIKLMVEGVFTTATYLDERLTAGWNGEFPLPDANYLSLPSEITFYEQLDAVLDGDGALTIAKALRDASYMVNTAEDGTAIALTQTSGFRQSLQRERGSIKAFLDGWKIFARETMDVLDLGFRFKDVFSNISTLELKFQAVSPLPHDVNVLIGANGAGKSRVLHQIVADWIGDSPDGGEAQEVGFARKPNLSQIVVVSYSPFERFPVDLLTSKLQDKNAYRYFGFRGRSIPKVANKLGAITLTHEHPKRSAAVSLLDCLADDQRYRSFSAWAEKLKTAEQVLRTAFEFDFAAVQVNGDQPAERFHDDPLNDDTVIDLEEIDYKGRYVAIRSDRLRTLDLAHIREDLVAAEGVVFFKDGAPIELSSGQKLFSFIVINILGAIRRDSLVLIDEPELFLHPALEIQFIDMLKEILGRFNSKALVATHSEVTVREVPSACVHVLQRTEDGLVISKPPFQTFGGDVQRISSYVFADSTTSKPFERWIRGNLKTYNGADGLIAALGENINEELIVQIRALDRARAAELDLW